MRTPGVAEPHVLPALEPIINAFSTEPECRLNENTSLIVIAEACLGIIVQQILCLVDNSTFLHHYNIRVSTARDEDDLRASKR